MARCSTRGPCAAVSRGRQAAKRESTPFRQHKDVLSKSPAPAHGLAAHGWAASAQRGGLLFWLLFSWPRKRQVTRAPQAHETLLVLAPRDAPGSTPNAVARRKPQFQNKGIARE